jgi:hypothetical protein
MSRPNVCNVVECVLPKLYVGNTTFGLCRDHCLDLPPVIRQSLLQTAIDTPEREAAEGQLMDWMISVSSACAHRVLAKSLVPCELCARASRKGKR